MAAPGVNVTDALWETTTDAVVSVAVYATVSTVLSVTEKVAWPAASVTPFSVETVEEPPPAASVTV